MKYIIAKRDPDGNDYAFFQKNAPANMRHLQWTHEREKCRELSKADAVATMKHLKGRREPIEGGRWKIEMRKLP